MTPELPSPEDEQSLENWLRVKPQAVLPPHVDPALPHLSALERSAEVLRYTVQCLEHWLSPQGVLREWLRRNVRLALALMVPLLVFAPVVTLAIDELQGWSTGVAHIAANLAQMPAVTTTLLLSSAGMVLYRWLVR